MCTMRFREVDDVEHFLLRCGNWVKEMLKKHMEEIVKGLQNQ